MKKQQTIAKHVGADDPVCPLLKRSTQKGITLVALVITIIVLLILVVVSIRLVVNNGIIGKAKYGVDKYSEQYELEKIQLAVSAAQLAGNGTITTENLNNELKHNFNNNSEVTESSLGWSYKADKGYRIYKDGKVEESILPIEYQQVEYIESTGTQFIDTGYKFIKQAPIRIISNFEVTKYNSITDCLFGLYDASASLPRLYFARFHRNHGYKLVYGYGIEYYKDYKLDINTKTKHEFYATNNLQQYYIDNTLWYTDNRSGYFSSNQISGQIFCLDSRYYGCFKLYDFMLYHDNILVRNFIPCYSTTTVTDINDKQCSKGTIGLYDLVENKFYTNQGTGTFIKGNDV